MLKKRIPSALPLYCAAAVWIVMGFVLPIYKMWAIIVTLVVSAAVGIVARRLFPGREIEYKKPAASGDAEIDRQIEEGRATLARIHEANVAIEDEVISAQILRMENAGEAIFAALEEDVRRAPQVRKFMNYYLPTADKLLDKYRSLSGIAGGENVAGAVKGVLCTV